MANAPEELLTHDRLQRSLAAHLRDGMFRVFTEIEIHGLPGGQGRLDLVALKPSYAHKDIRGYEVKASRADLLRGLESGRWGDYRACFHRMYFALPAPSKSFKWEIKEIPEECGILSYSQRGWVSLRQARSHIPPHLTTDVMLSLCLRGLEEAQETRNLKERVVWLDNKIVQPMAKSFGHEVARRVNQTYERPVLEPALQHLKELIEQELGVSLDENIYRLSHVEQRVRSLFQLVRAVDDERAMLNLITGYLRGLGEDRLGMFADQADELKTKLQEAACVPSL